MLTYAIDFYRKKSKFLVPSQELSHKIQYITEWVYKLFVI